MNSPEDAGTRPLPRLQVRQCFLSVDDHDAAIAFYRDALGFEVRSDVRVNGVRWVTVGAASQPELDVVLHPPAPDPGISPAQRTAISGLLADGLLGRLCLVTPDLDGTFDRVQASGAEVLQEPMDHPGGIRDCVFFDPAWNVIRISQSWG